MKKLITDWIRYIFWAANTGWLDCTSGTAAQNPGFEGSKAAAKLNRHGAQAFVLPLAPRLAGSDVRKAADDPALAEAVRTAGGVFWSIYRIRMDVRPVRMQQPLYTVE